MQPIKYYTFIAKFLKQKNPCYVSIQKFYFIVILVCSLYYSIDARDFVDNNPFAKVVESGNVLDLTLLIHKDLKDEQISLWLEPVLLYASYLNKSDFIEYCLKNGVSVKGDEYHMPIYWAIKGNHFQLVEKYLALGAVLKESRESPLHHATTPEMIDYLMEYCSDLNYPNHFLSTPLHYYIYYGHYECARRIIDLGAQINPINVYGNTPIDLIDEEIGFPKSLRFKKWIESRGAISGMSLRNP